MTTITLEERVALLEREVLTLKRQLSKPTTTPWGDQVHGVFADVPAFSEATELGRQYREAQRPTADEDTDVAP